MEEINIEELNIGNTRKEYRDNIIILFLNEEPGTGRGANTSKYRYITKTLPDGHQVCLHRPAQFNNGFDFTINVSGIDFNSDIPDKRATTRPSHGHIIDDLINKLAENEDLYESLFEQIEKLYNCEELTNDDFNFDTGYTAQLILECMLCPLCHH